MENENMKKCPYCAEMIKDEAVMCRYCGSNLREKKPTHDFSINFVHWKRVKEGKKIAGVCTGIASEFNAPQIILPLRLFFILSTLFYGFGLILYIVLWILMPEPVERAKKDKRDVPYYTDTMESDIPEIKYHKKISHTNVALGFFLIVAGIFLILSIFTLGRGLSIPFFGHFYLPRIFHPNIWVETPWFLSLCTLLTVFGLFILFLGGLKFIRFFVGCSLVIIGALLLVVFIPFMPKLFLFPGLLIVGLILIIIGGIKLILSS